jgi:L-lactate dehydrogenase (cytochrome)
VQKPLASYWQKRRLDQVFCLNDFEAIAQRFLPKSIFSYVVSPAETGQSLRDNSKVFEEIAFVPRVLRNVSARKIHKTLFGQEWSAPFGISPMGISALSAYNGDRVLAQSAQSENIPMVMSGSSLTKLEDVIKVAPNSWFQAYLPPTSDRIAALVDRVAKAGYQTLVITVDVAVRGSTEHYERAGFVSPIKPNLSFLCDGVTHLGWSFGVLLKTVFRSGIPHFENGDSDHPIPVISRNAVREFSGRSHLDWDAIKKIRAQWRGNLVLKGVLHPEDAVHAKNIGADGIVLSNHGGRQLDGAISPMRVLPAVRAAVGDLPLLIDGGFRRGTDILKALALGADFVFIARPFNYAASIGGQAGVCKAIRILKKELEMGLGMLGACDLSQLSPDQLSIKEAFFCKFDNIKNSLKQDKN